MHLVTVRCACIIAAAVIGTAGCGSGSPQAAPTAVTSVVTDTARTTVTATVTSTATATTSVMSTVTTTVTATSTVGSTAIDVPRSTTAPAASMDTGTETDQPSVLLHAGRVVEDVQTADERIASGYYSNLATTMAFLEKDFSALQSDGAPPGSDAVQYLALCQTLTEFAGLASNEFATGNASDAIARYTVMRQHITEVLSTINTAYGSQYAV
jgi:hypothetical protein